MVAIIPDKCCGPRSGRAIVDDREKHLYGLNALLELGFCFLQLLVVFDVGRLCRWAWLRRLGHVGTRSNIDVFKLSRSCKAEITSNVITVDEMRRTHCNLAHEVTAVPDSCLAVSMAREVYQRI